MSERVEPTFVDTNVLLSATAPARALYAQASVVLQRWPEEGRELALSGQVVREYLAVATRASETNGLGLSMSDAIENIERMLQRMTLLDEPLAATRHLLLLLRNKRSLGNHVHDVHIVATMKAHGIARLLTDNVRHFARFDIQLVELQAVAV